MARLQYGRYETLGLIASGGMASVHLGRARGPAGFERLVAIKVMHEHIAGDPEFSSMFLDEARLAARIRHPNVVPTLDVSEDGRIIVMEYVEGASLSTILRQLRSQDRALLSLPVALRIVLDMLEGLHAAHELRDKDGTAVNLVHRDVSPHNVLVGVDGISRITDFGIAYAQSRLTSTRDGKLKGKMPYMAPEQLQGKEADRRVDVYAAGCVLWELLTGERLFSANNDAALACRILAGPTRTPRQVRDGVPGVLDDACMQALLPCERRFVTAQAFAEALEGAAAEAGITIARARNVAVVAKAAHVVVPLPPSSRLETMSTEPDPAPGPDGQGPQAPAGQAPSGPPLTAATRTVTAAPAEQEIPPAALRVVAAVGAAPASAAGTDRPTTATGTLRCEDDPPSSELASAPDVAPAVESARTISSVVAPVSIDRKPRVLRWGVAVVGAVLLTTIGVWLVVRPLGGASGGDGAAGGAAMASVSAVAADRATGHGLTLPGSSATADEPASAPRAGTHPAWPGAPASVSRPGATAHSTSGATAGTIAPAGPATTPPPQPPAAPSSTVYHPPKL